MKKTQFIVISRKPYNENEYVKIGTYNLYNFEIVKHYTYLDKIVRNKN